MAADKSVEGLEALRRVATRTPVALDFRLYMHNEANLESFNCMKRKENRPFSFGFVWVRFGPKLALDWHQIGFLG